MCTESELNTILNEFAKSSRQAFGDELNEIILYGSYARGDYDEESDVDIAILMNVPKENETEYHKALTKIIGDIYEKYGYSPVLSPIVISSVFFDEWKECLPFYRNVAREGVKIVA